MCYVCVPCYMRKSGENHEVLRESARRLRKKVGPHRQFPARAKGPDGIGSSPSRAPPRAAVLLPVALRLASPFASQIDAAAPASPFASQIDADKPAPSARVALRLPDWAPSSAADSRSSSRCRLALLLAPPSSSRHRRPPRVALRLPDRGSQGGDPPRSPSVRSRRPAQDEAAPPRRRPASAVLLLLALVVAPPSSSSRKFPASPSRSTSCSNQEGSASPSPIRLHAAAAHEARSRFVPPRRGRACLMSWRATTALRPPRRPDG